MDMGGDMIAIKREAQPSLSTLSAYLPLTFQLAL